MKRWPTSLTIKEMQIKTRMTDHLTSVRMTKIKKKNIRNNKQWYLEKKGNLGTVGENAN